ncbi:helix-turn-helix transcriptional regulator [Oceanithermus sp.]|uniref:helix-turn-helix domain-containing protein n=1 Tax=Oceanithermus sp. TaxID=2268145 RepID=UPI00257F2C86|nr:helix-turn-helix transcriptional regulator [Oceanithermus sp.]
MTLAQKIKGLREEKKISRAELRRRTRLTYMTIWRLETGAEDNPTIDTLRRVAKALEVHVCDLIDN